VTAEPAQGWTVEALVELASSQDYAVTERQLESWRNQGLLPPQTRGPQRGLRPTWTSPPGTEITLLKLCKLRETTKDPAALLLGLWLGGEEQSLDRIRRAVSDVLDDAEQTIGREVTKIQQRRRRDGGPPCTEEEALRELARRFALARVGDRLLPRVRSGSAHRLAGCTDLLLMFVTGQAPAQSVGNVSNVELALGVLPRGRLDRLDPALDPKGSVPAWLKDEPLDFDLMARTVSLPAFRTALATASDEDLLYARYALRPLTHGLELFARFVSAFHDDKPNFLGMGLLRHSRSTPEWSGLLVCLVLAARQNELRDNLEEVVEALADAGRTLSGGLRQLLLMPAATRQRKLDKLGKPRLARRLSSVLDEFATRRDKQ